MKISNLVTNNTKAKGFNKDLFLHERENIEVDEFNINRETNQGVIYLGSDNKDNMLIEHVIIFLDDTNGIYLPYSFNIIQKRYNADKQLTISRQALTLKGFNWLINKNDVLSTLKDETVISNYYQQELDKLKVMDNNNKLLPYADFLSLGEITPKGWFIVQFEDSIKHHKITFNPDGYLYSIDSKIVETKQELKPLFETPVTESEEEKMLNDEEKEEKELKGFFS